MPSIIRLIVTTVIASGVLATASYAGTPEDDYLAARNAQYAIIQKADAANRSQDELTKLDAAGREVLKQRLLAVFDKSSLPTGMGKPFFQPETLQDGYIQSDSVDGLAFSAAKGSHIYLYTTESIVKQWANGMTSNSEIADALKSGVPGLLATETFMHHALNFDAAAVEYLALPVHSKTGVSRAFVGLYSQDIPSSPPDTIFFTVAKNGKVVVASVKTKTVIADPVKCAKFKYNDDNPGSYVECVTPILAKAPQFATLTAEAQKLVDAVVSRLP